MSFNRTFKRKNKDGTIKTYYAEVESVRIGNKVVQHYVRPLGTDPEHPTNIPIEQVHFSYLALRLMQDALTPNDLFEMLENMGQPIKKEEIQLFLEGRGINISTGEISNLSEEFLLRFYGAESGDEITFTAKDGITVYTPIAVVRDMSDEIAISVTDVFPGVPQQVCQYHFVRNLGDIIFKNRYETFRRVMLNTNILARIVALKKNCTVGISTSDKMMIAERYWVLLAIEYVIYPRERKSDYPFALPYFEVLNRLINI